MKYLDQRRRAADDVRRLSKLLPDHKVAAEKDYGKAFRSRPGSDDWKAHCSCGWESSGWHHGETEALASAARHMRRSSKEISR